MAERVEKGCDSRPPAATVGVRTPEGVALAAAVRTRSLLQVPESVEKIHEADAHVGIGTAGHAADGRRLVDVARREAQVERLRYDRPAGVETLTEAVTDHVQEYTKTGGARPYGVALLVASTGSRGDAPAVRDRPLGDALRVAGGRHRRRLRDDRDYLEREHEEGLLVDAGVDLALSALAEQNGGTLDPVGASAATVPVSTGTYERLADGTLRERVEALGLDAAS